MVVKLLKSVKDKRPVLRKKTKVIPCTIGYYALLGKASKGSMNAHRKCLTEKKNYSMVSEYANIRPYIPAQV